ncbi:MAG: 2-aminoethylphosphonate ABC transporter permease subunit [Thermogemmatispora sp.]|uniref:2-aminoethylphosphonate ABC transporter permease subunit n=1 Tax=Thermogemmatispora sp. TaxID=1968838 RepID=UPI0019DBDEF7|nr:2-aminoethylphosphonate ABC transporter permease subunit [Thermogemmatispora sp.]MBE3567540.1 2-aminoethylphosphonate ABC transporter permease subunit [Thermogemmatispora sp.]
MYSWMSSKAARWLGPVGLLMLLAPCVLMPLGSLVITSLQTGAGWSLSAYGRVLTDPTFWQELIFTWRLALLATALVAVLGLALALALFFRPWKGMGLLLRAVELMVAFPSFLIAFALIYLYGSQGAVTLLLGHLWPQASGSPSFLYGIGGILLAEVTYYTPFMVRPMLAVLALLDQSVLEAASVLGASPWRLLRRVVIPLTRSALVAGILLSFLLLQNEFGILLVLGTLATPTVPVAIYSDALINLDLPRAAVEALVMLLASLLLYALYRWLLGRSGWDWEEPGLANAARAQLGQPPGRRSGLAWLLAILASPGMVVLFFLPVVAVVLAAFAENWAGSVLPHSYTLRWFLEMDSSDWLALEHSLLLAVGVAGLSVLQGMLAALGVVRLKGAIARFFDFLLMVPSAVPSVVVGLAVLLAYHSGPFSLAGTPWMVLLAQASLTLPFSYRTVHAALLKLPAEYREAAAGLGAPPWRVFWRITLPLLAPALRAAFAVSLAFSLGELGATLVVYPPGFTTAPLQMINAIERGFYAQAAALATLLLLLTLALLLLVAALQPERFGPFYSLLRRRLRAWPSRSTVEAPTAALPPS